MKIILLLVLSLFSLASCKKTVENAQRDAVVEIMVSGQWTVTKYMKGDSTITPQFAPYKFQFHDNGSVDATKNGVVEKTGTWKGDATLLTITSSFPGAGYPLPLLNGTFQISKTGLSFVEARMTVNGELHLLRLDK